jgi:hypothetical protein
MKLGVCGLCRKSKIFSSIFFQDNFFIDPAELSLYHLKKRFFWGHLMKFKIFVGIIFFSLLIFPLQYCSSPESPTETEDELEAELEISLEKSPVVMYKHSDGCWYPEWGRPKVIISETNGVGCSISTVKLEVMYEGEPCWPITVEGDRLKAFGSISVIIWDFFVCYEYERIKITATGGDDNGNSISESEYFYLFYGD